MNRIVSARGLTARDKARAIFVLFAMAVPLPAQKFTSLHSFGGTDGAYPVASLVQATNGDLYGTTEGSVPSTYYGSIFKITPNGKLTSLYSFCLSACTDGAFPAAGLVQYNNGDFYGTTSGGGASGNGTVFKITASGKLTTLHSFGGADGSLPLAGLVQAANGDFYGTTAGGGANSSGTVFRMTPGGKLTALYGFCSKVVGGFCADGLEPLAGLIQGTDGDLYGTTNGGGANASINNAGTIFRITPSGKLTTLYSFCSLSGCIDGASPYGGLVQATDGNFYGTTSLGGGTGCNGDGCGTVFQMTPSELHFETRDAGHILDDLLLVVKRGQEVTGIVP